MAERMNLIHWVKGTVRLSEHEKIHNVGLKAFGLATNGGAVIFLDAASTTTDPRLARLMAIPLVLVGAGSFGLGTYESALSNKRRLIPPEIESVKTTHSEEYSPSIDTIKEFIQKAKLLTKKGDRLYRNFRGDQESSLSLSIYTGLDSKSDTVYFTIREKPIRINNNRVNTVKRLEIDVTNGVATVKFRQEIEAKIEKERRSREESMKADDKLKALDESLGDANQEELENALAILSSLRVEDEIIRHSTRSRSETERDKAASATIKRKTKRLLTIAKEEGVMSQRDGFSSADFDINGKTVSVLTSDTPKTRKRDSYILIKIPDIAGQGGGSFSTREFVLYGKKSELSIREYGGVNEHNSSGRGIGSRQDPEEFVNSSGWFKDLEIPTNGQVQGLLTTLSTLGIQSLRGQSR